MLPDWLDALASSDRFLCFADLHVSQASIERCVDVLRRVRMLAVQHAVPVVFLGDFWEHRGSVSVRQVSALLPEFRAWQDQGVRAVLIPGNHDQVSRDGVIHGLEMFSVFSNIAVATEPVIFPRYGVAFLPWRADQEQLFAQLAQYPEVAGRWLVFSHAEVGGATTNLGYQTNGRVRLGAIQHVASQCYLGHFHKRQCLGTQGNVWYIGSPYQQSFGELGQPFGAALVRRGVGEPEWMDAHFAHLPVHHRLQHPWQQNDPALHRIRQQDIVQVYVSRWSDPRLEAALSSLPTRRVSTRVLPPPNAGLPEGLEPESSTTRSVSLPEVMRQYVERDSAGLPDGVTAEELIKAGEELVHASDSSLMGQFANPTRAANRMASVIMPTHIRISNFAGIRGTLEFDFADKGLMMLRGDVGVGKTSLVDALTWVLFDSTAPRKAGSSSAGFKGDEVIHDSSKSAEVEVTLELDRDTTRTLVIRRTKAKKQGSRLTLKPSFRHPLLQERQGVSDTQQMLQRALGFDVNFWRICCYSGQGATSGFVTDADKARKEALASIFGLSGLEVVAVEARQALKRAETKIRQLRASIDTCERVLTSLTAEPLQQKSQAFESEKQAAIQAAERVDPSVVERLDDLPTPDVIQRDIGRITSERNEAESRLPSEACYVCGAPASEQYRKSVKDSIRACEERLAALEIDLRDSREAELVRTANDWRAKENPFQAHLAHLDETRFVQRKTIKDDTTQLAVWQRKEAVSAFWERGFGSKGVPSMMLDQRLSELEVRANQVLADLTGNKLILTLRIVRDGLELKVVEIDGSRQSAPRRYEMLSGGQRRCVELAFSPFALSEMLFLSVGVRIPLLVVDELTTHLGAAEKQRACDMLRRQGRDAVIVIDHDDSVRGEFDSVLQMTRDSTNGCVRLALE